MTKSGINVEININKVPGIGGVTSKGRDTYSYSINSIQVTIKVEECTSEITKYKKLSYTPNSGKISKIKKGGVPLNEFNNALQDVTTVSVYYWTGDREYKTPLLVQPGTEKTYYYYNTTREAKWEKDSQAPNDLKDKLDKQNCKRNKAHQIELNNKDNNNKETSCNAKGCNQKFYIESTQKSEYTKYQFKPKTSDNVQYMYFTSGYNGIHTGLSYPKGLQSVSVYWKTRQTKPSIIHYNSNGTNQWYRLTDTANNWKQIPSESVKFVGENDSEIIKNLIDGKYPPTITVNIENGRDVSGDGQFSTYPDAGKKINVARKDVMVDENTTEYTSFTHQPEDYTYFMLREIKRGGQRW